MKQNSNKVHRHAAVCSIAPSSLLFFFGSIFMVFNFTIYFYLTSKLAASSSFESSTRSLRPQLLPQELNRNTEILDMTDSDPPQKQPSYIVENSIEQNSPSEGMSRDQTQSSSSSSITHDQEQQNSDTDKVSQKQPSMIKVPPLPPPPPPPPRSEVSSSSSSRVEHEIEKNDKVRSSAIHIDGGHKEFPCDVPCFLPSKKRGGVMHSLRIDELDVTMAFSMEGEQYYPALKLSNRRPDHLIASTRWESDIPLPYYHFPWTLYMDKLPSGKDIWSQNYIQTPHVPLSEVKKAGVFIARNCNSKSNRESLVKSLISKMPVDSVSSCLHNFNIGDKKDKIKMMRKYAFYFAFENQRVDDYITEKLWKTFRAGVLPVYFGAPNIKEHVPDHSIVSVDDFESHDALVSHLKAILSDEDLYNSYHAWRYKPIPSWFVRLYNFTHVHSACRICRFASAKINHQTWDPAQQRIYVPPQIHSYRKGKYDVFILNKESMSSLTVTGSGTVNILTQRKFGLFGHSVSESTTFTWKKNDAALWMATTGHIKISEPNQNSNQVAVAWPRRTINFVRRNSGKGQITLCTQMSIDRFPRLVHLAKTWGGPISAAIYVRDQEEAVQIRETWQSEDSMRKWVDIHVVYDDDKPWFRFSDLKEGAYPVNLLRQIAVENARTELVLYIEANIQVQNQAHDKVAAIDISAYPSNSAFVLPLYSAKSVPTSIDRWSDFKRIPYSSHKGLNFQAWEAESSNILTYKGIKASPGMESQISSQEPYFLAHKSSLPSYNVLYWSMMEDKVSHINSMSHNFYVLPGCFLVDTPSTGLGKPRLTKTNENRDMLKVFQPLFKKLLIK